MQDDAVTMGEEGIKEVVPVGTIIRTPKRHLSPRSPGQKRYIRALLENEMTFGLGPAGTGKTYLAVGMAVSMLATGKVDRIVLSRRRSRRAKD